MSEQGSWRAGSLCAEVTVSRVTSALPPRSVAREAVAGAAV